MKEDDKDDEANESNPVRYPVLPSLVALQQMKGRYKLASLGKKLMKWTAMATLREARVAAEQVSTLYLHYEQEVKMSYIHLARARYFYPNLNKIVLSNLPIKARLSVTHTNRSVAGVKIKVIHAEDTDKDPYPHLGIDKGGQQILEAKEAWRKLLISSIMAVQLRNMYTQLDVANKTANKKANVLQKLVIPRIHCTVKYIESELDETEREEMFRLKRFKELKVKRTREADKTAKKPEVVPPTVPSPEKIEPSISIIPPPLLLALPPPPCSCSNRVIELRDTASSPCGEYATDEDADEDVDEEKQLEILKTHLGQVIDLARQCQKEGVEDSSIEDLIQLCESAKGRYSEKPQPQPVCSVCPATESETTPPCACKSSKTLGPDEGPEKTSSEAIVTPRVITITIETRRPVNNDNIESEEFVSSCLASLSREIKRHSCQTRETRSHTEPPGPFITTNVWKSASCDHLRNKEGKICTYPTDSIKVQVVPCGSAESVSNTERQTGNLHYSGSFDFESHKTKPKTETKTLSSIPIIKERGSSNRCSCSQLPKSYSSSGIVDASCETDSIEEEEGILNALNKLLLTFDWAWNDEDIGIETDRPRVCSSCSSRARTQTSRYHNLETCGGGYRTESSTDRDSSNFASSSKYACGHPKTKRNCATTCRHSARTSSRSFGKSKWDEAYELPQICPCVKNRKDTKKRHSDTHLIRASTPPDKKLKKSTSYYIDCDCDL